MADQCETSIRGYLASIVLGVEMGMGAPPRSRNAEVLAAPHPAMCPRDAAGHRWRPRGCWGPAIGRLRHGGPRVHCRPVSMRRWPPAQASAWPLAACLGGGLERICLGALGLDSDLPFDRGLRYGGNATLTGWAVAARAKSRPHRLGRWFALPVAVLEREPRSRASYFSARRGSGGAKGKRAHLIRRSRVQTPARTFG